MTTSTATQVHEIPDEIRALAPPDGYDYVDLFVLTTTGAAEHSAETWARTALEDSPRIGRFLAWEMLCQLRLDVRRSPEQLAGWKVTERGDDSITMDAAGWFMAARMVFHVVGERVSFATFVRYERGIGARWWPQVATVHRKVAPRMLRAAGSRIRRAGRASLSG